MNSSTKGVCCLFLSLGEREEEVQIFDDKDRVNNFCSCLLLLLSSVVGYSRWMKD